MKLHEMALAGLKGRKKDSLLLKLVITLAFIFIIVSIVFISSLELTRQEQRLNLHGQWQAAYLDGNKEILERLENEPLVDKIGDSLIIGESENAGVVGTFNNELIEMGRFSMYKGRLPEKPNEIMVELNEMSRMGLDLEVGQEVEIAIEIPTIDRSPDNYVNELNKKFQEDDPEDVGRLYNEMDIVYGKIQKLEGDNSLEATQEIRKLTEEIFRIRDELNVTRRQRKHYRHNEWPFEEIDDVMVVASNNYFYYYLDGDMVNPDIIREEGFLMKQKLVLKKKFTVTGILDTYTDKWDLGGYKTPNSFITEEGGDIFVNALYSSTIADLSDHEMKYQIFLESDSVKENLYNTLSEDYKNDIVLEEVDQVEIEGENIWTRPREENDWRTDYLISNKDLDGGIKTNTDNFRRNLFSYPEDTKSTEYIITLAIIGIIFIATALAVLQIFLTQIKKRTRKIVLLKSIGATNWQVIKILLYEGLYLLRTGIFVGIPIGFAISIGLVFFMGKFGSESIQFHIIPNLLFLGILSGILALLIGMLVPIIYALGIPLVGTISKPPKHKNIKKKENKEIKIQSFNYINWRDLQLNKGKALISLGISTITITILLSSLLLAYIFFDKYKTDVMVNNRPDYGMEIYYGESSRVIKEQESELLNIKGVKSAETYKVGKQTFLWYEGIEENQILKKLKDTMPEDYLQNYFSSYNEELIEEPEWIKNAFYTKLYGIDVDSKLYNQFKSAITVGDTDKDKFKNGEEVILLVPLTYENPNETIDESIGKDVIIDSTDEANRIKWVLENKIDYKLSYNSRYKDYYERQEDIKVGDIIHVSADDEKMVGSELVISHTTKEVKVGGIIYHFPDENIWPFSKDVPPYTIITSYSGVGKIFTKSTSKNPSLNKEDLKIMTNSVYPTSYGRTLWYIETEGREQNPILDAELLAFANNNGYTLLNYKESNIKLYHEALNNGVIIVLLGLTAAIIASIILYNTTVSKLEQDRNKIGILQSLGVTKNEFSKHFIKLGIISGILALAIAHLLLLAVLLLTSLDSASELSMTFNGYLKDIFTYRLWKYPWAAHLALSAVFFVSTVLLHYIPSRAITSKYPVENIRSLGR